MLIERRDAHGRAPDGSRTEGDQRGRQGGRRGAWLAEEDALVEEREGGVSLEREGARHRRIERCRLDHHERGGEEEEDSPQPAHTSPRPHGKKWSR